MSSTANKQEEEYCRFCKIMNNSDRIVYADEQVVVFLDIDPISRGHVLIVPRVHYLDVDELPSALLLHIMKVSQKVVSILKKEWSPAGYSMMQNGGAFNDIGHFHLHVFPRFTPEEFSWTYLETTASLDPNPQETLSLLRIGLAPTDA